MTDRLNIFTLALMLFVFAAPPALAADTGTAKAPAHATLEQQVEYLESGLSEGLATLDWKMIGMALDGFKAANVAGKDLEASILRAERDAALSPAGRNMGAPILALGLTARAKTNDTKAASKLRTWALTDLPAVSVPDTNTFQANPAGYRAGLKAYQDYEQALAKKEWAVLGLALLKDPGLAQKALAAIRSKTPTARVVNEPLVLAALLADPQTGLKGLLDICNDPKVALGEQTAILSVLTRLSPDSKAQKAAAEAYTLLADVGAQLPRDALAQLAKAYIAVVKRWQADPANPNDFSLNTLVNIGYVFGPNTIDKEGIAAIAALRDRITGQQAQWLKPSVDQLLTNLGADPNAAVAPPKAPEGF